MINFNPRKKVQKNLVTKREFKYAKNKCNLNFILMIDQKDEIKDFRECLIEAIDDIDDLLKNFV